MAKKRTPKPPKAPDLPVMCSFTINENGPKSYIYNTMSDSSPNVPTEDEYIMHMGRAIGKQNQEYEMWQKIMDFAKDVNYEHRYNITGSH